MSITFFSDLVKNADDHRLKIKWYILEATSFLCISISYKDIPTPAIPVLSMLCSKTTAKKEDDGAFLIDVK